MPDRDDITKAPWYGKSPTDEELKQILADHKAWVEAGMKGDPPHDLRGINLSRRDLEGAKLRKVNFFQANLEQAYLNKTDLREALLEKAELSFAEFRKSQLQWANLRAVTCYGTKFQGANLSKACLEKANLFETKFNESWFFKANLQHADLTNSILQNARLTKSNLTGASLNGAYLQGAKCHKAIFIGADLRWSHFSDAVVTGVKYDRKMKCLGIRAETCYGSPMFKRHVQDLAWLEEFREHHPVWYWLWWLFADCGRSISLWAFWSILFAVLFGAVYYYHLGEEHFHLSQLSWNFSTTMYYSVVTFTTLGFGDVVPKTLAAAYWIVAEVITGYIMLGGLVSILANKLARRS